MKNLIGMLLVVLLFSCNAEQNKQKTIYVSLLPHKYFVEKIAGDKFVVKNMIPAGFSAEMFEPLPRQVMEIKNTNLFFLSGMPYEKIWTDKFKEINSGLIFIDLNQGIKLRKLETPEVFSISEADEHDHDHSDGESHSHNHLYYDVHTWLEISNAKIISKTIMETLVKADPSNESYYKNNYQILLNLLDKTGSHIDSQLAGSEGKSFLVFHPAWGYLADRYKITQIPIEFEGKEPSAFMIQKILNIAKNRNVKVIFIEEQMSTHSAKMISEKLKIPVIKLDPLSYDYINNLIKSVNVFRENL